MAAMIADAAKRKRTRNAVLRRQTELAFTGPLGLVAYAKCILLARSAEAPMRRPPSSAANESWPHEQFCQSAFDPSKAVVAQGTPRAAMSDLGLSGFFLRQCRLVLPLFPKNGLNPQNRTSVVSLYLVTIPNMPHAVDIKVNAPIGIVWVGGIARARLTDFQRVANLRDVRPTKMI